MVFGWLDRKFGNSQRAEADQFLVSLKGADTEVVDMIHGYTMAWALFYARQSIFLYKMEDWLGENLLFPLELNRHIKKQQKAGDPQSATGLMVWLFSSRALMYPELRLGGRNIWRELSRSTPLSERIGEDIAISMGFTMGHSIKNISRSSVPSGLQIEGY